LITINNLVKKFDKKIVAVDHISLEIGDNEVFGLLGPNGAGKTTLIHMLATLIKPTSGTAIVNGFDIIKQPGKVRESIGIIFQSPSSDDLLTGRENLRIHAMLYGVPPTIIEKRISEVLALVELMERKDDQIKTYSGGMRRRLEIARGLLHNPKVLFLDEPTLGLDPSSRETMWDHIQKLVREKQLSVILTTHYMEEAEMLCDRIGIIDKGKIIALDSPEKLKMTIGGDVIEIRLKGDPVRELNDKRLWPIHDLKSVQNMEVSEDGLVSLTVDDAGTNIPEVLKLINVQHITFRSPTLNDVFLKMTGRSIRKQQAEGGFMERYVQYGRNT
jgi:ABC-2 type transport system ATP-binding protein